MDFPERVRTRSTCRTAIKCFDVLFDDVADAWFELPFYAARNPYQESYLCSKAHEACIFVTVWRILCTWNGADSADFFFSPQSGGFSFSEQKAEIRSRGLRDLLRDLCNVVTT